MKSTKPSASAKAAIPPNHITARSGNRMRAVMNLMAVSFWNIPMLSA
jgi:hypothetical protein